MGSDADTMDRESLSCNLSLRSLNMVVRVVPSLVVVMSASGKACPGGISSDGIT